MADETLFAKVQDLSDLELATLLCLVHQEHCIIDTDPGAEDDLVHELRLVASTFFGLSSVVVDCSESTTLQDFDAAVQPPRPPPGTPSPRDRQDSYFSQFPDFRSPSRLPPHLETPDSHGDIPSVVIGKNLDDAPGIVQTRVLELMRSKPLQDAPRPLLFMAVIAGGDGPRLQEHLNNHIFISHYHDPEDGYPNLDELDSDAESACSVVRKPVNFEPSLDPVFGSADISTLQSLTASVFVSAEITRYLTNIIAFLRIHRAVMGGISPLATKHSDKLAKSLAPLHGLDYVTPSLVALAVKKIYPHRICIVPPEKERSVQWGSNIDAVAVALEGMGAETILEDVLANVDVPV